MVDADALHESGKVFDGLVKGDGLHKFGSLEITEILNKVGMIGNIKKADRFASRLDSTTNCI